MGLNPFWINYKFKLFYCKLSFVCSQRNSFLLQADIFQIFLEYFAILSLKSYHFISFCSVKRLTKFLIKKGRSSKKDETLSTVVVFEWPQTWMDYLFSNSHLKLSKENYLAKENNSEIRFFLKTCNQNTIAKMFWPYCAL